MDCTQAQQLISDRQGAKLVDVAELDAALAHCDTCPACASFARGLATLDAIPRPVAPDRAVRRALDAVQAARQADAQSAAPPDGQPAPIPVPTAETSERAPIAFWGRLAGSQRFAVVASAAAVFGIGVFVTVRVLSASLGTPANSPELADQVVAPSVSAPAAGESTLEADDEATGRSSIEAGAAPDYVVFSGSVWVVGTPNNTVDVLASLAGSVVTARDSEPADAENVDVFRDSQGAYYLEGEGTDDYSRLTLVTRTFDGEEFALTSDREIEAFGAWPELPGYIPTPTADDGTPVLSVAGTDDRGVDVFVRLGGSPADGFAIAPGSASSDPAGGNPNWTWWAPTGS